MAIFSDIDFKQIYDALIETLFMSGVSLIFAVIFGIVMVKNRHLGNA